MQSATSHYSSPLKSKRKYSDDTSSFEEGGSSEQVSHSSPTHKHARRLNLSSLPKRTPSFASSRSAGGPNQVAPSSEHVGMDVDNGSTSSDSDEQELPTPSFPYPSNLQYPFGLPVGGGGGAKHGGGGGAAQAHEQEGMMVDSVEVGLRGPKEGQLHGSQCTSIPRVVLSHPLPSGERSLWSVCQDCGAVSPC